MSIADSSPYNRPELFQSVDAEHPQPIKTTVKGHIPQWLNGCLLRNGPGKFEFGQDKYNHFFDGSALLHRFHIKDGDVTYQSRFLQSDAYMSNKASNRIVVSELGTLVHPDPCKNIFKRFFSYFTGPEVTDNCCVNWFQVGEDFFVCTETQLIHKVDLETLESRGKVDYSKFVAVNSATAHPHQVGNELYNVGNSFGSRTAYNIIKIKQNDKLGKEAEPIDADVLCSIPSSYRSAPSYYHSFGITDNYIIFLEQPLFVTLWKVLTAKLRQSTVLDALEFCPEECARFHVIRRDTGELLQQQYTSDAFFCFHFANAYEEEGQLVVDLCAYDDTKVLSEGFLSMLRDPSQRPFCDAEFRRFVLPLPKENKDTVIGENLVSLDYTSSTAIRQSDGRIHVTWESLFTDLPGFEMPRINYERCNGKPYRYVYGFLQGTFELAKLDLKENTVKIWGEESYAVSEPVFVPSPDAVDEDDGVVLSCVLSFRSENLPYVVILDAKSFKEIARAEVPTYMPFGLHHIFTPDQPLKK